MKIIKGRTEKKADSNHYGMVVITTFSFYVPDINIVLADPHRAGHELKYHPPGEVNMRMADVVVINKIETAPPEG